MNLYFRFIFLLLKRVFLPKPSINILEACRTTFFVNPLDLDINVHMNNGRYLSLMDLGRIDLMIKSNVFWKLFKNGYYPIVVTEGIRFKKSLLPFQKFIIETKINTLDQKDFFISQKFFHKNELVANELVAEGVIQGRFKKKGRKESISTVELFNFLNLNSEEIKDTNLSLAVKNLGQELCQK